MRRGWRAGSNVIRLTPWRRRRYRWWLGAGLVLLPAAMWLAVQGPGTGGGGPSSPDLSWTKILGAAGNLRAAVSDGTSEWWVREGDVLAGDWRVTRIAARPPGVTLSHDRDGDHALPYAGGAEPQPGEVLTTAPGGSASLSGPARVIDGDTLELRDTRVRLHGIDAPESEQRCRADGRLWPCGQDATQALARHVGSGTVACEERDRDRYGRVVAVCRVGGGDINAWMVAQGWALAYRRYSMDYAAEEGAARAAKRGVWQGDVVAPWDWRRGVRLAGE
ncbi:MAG: thermonuclease family protein [bacterium]|nr:thermonuclease family protein [bacterium]